MQDRDRRPNFVFVYTDDQRWDALGVVQREQGAKARFPWFRTPNLDRVAAEGVRFRNAFVVSALCAPSRAAFLTGRCNHRNGVANNHTPFPERSVTHATLLRAAGYATAYVGKWHMGNQRERPGFDYAASFVGQGRYHDCPFVVNGKDTPTTGWVDDVTTDYAVEYLRRQNRAGKPFSLVVGYKSSHGPWNPPQRAKDRFAGEVSRPVPNLDVNAVYRPEMRPGGYAAGNPDRAQMQRSYFRTLSAVDDNVGRLLKALDELGLAQNTVFVYSSDNGYYLGEHGLGDKRSAYEESIRVPLLVRWPGRVPRGGRTEDAMVLNVDLAPTLLEAAGVPVPREMQGRSLLPYLGGRGGARPRESFFYEYFYERGYPAIPTVFAVRTPDAKLVKYPGHDEWTELFDLKADPYETKNLYADPAQEPLRRRMLAAYDRAAKESDFRIPDYADRPGEEQQAVRPPAAARDREVLRFEAPLAPEEKDRIRDRSGLGNHGTIHGSVTNASGPPGNTPLVFAGGGYIEVPNSPSLNPAGGPWTVEVAIKPEKPDGVILARGGQSLGYALFLDGGAVCFAVNSGLGNPAVVRDGGPRVSAGADAPMVRVRAVITRDRRARLFVDGREVGSAPLSSFITGEPNDRMQIGADLQTTVVPYPKPDRFTGAIASVRLFSGEEPR